MQNNWFSEAKRQLRSGRLEGAYETALARLSDEREDGDAWGIMSLVALAGGNLPKSLELSAKALELGVESVLIRGGRGQALLATGRQDEARELAKAVEPSACETALDADTIGVILARTGQQERAVEFFRQAVEAEPENPQFHYNLATSTQFVGDLERAKHSYGEVLALDPAFHRARLALVQLQEPDEYDLPAIEQMFAALGDNADGALQLGHAAAKICEARAEYAASLEWLLRAKQMKKRAISHDRDWANALFGAARAAADAVAVTEPLQGQRTPVFIVGMPRSGTTLVERILSSHSAVATAGELPDLALLVKRSGGTAGAHTLAPEVITGPYDPAQIGAEYLGRTALLTAGRSHLIDKMPFNFFFAPHILRSLPDARIVMVRRDPRDTVFANFRQLFATDFGYYDYAYDLDDTAHFVAGFSQLAEHLAQALPPERYTEVHYEDLITDQEQRSRRLIEFLGLEWEEQCLQFHRNTAPVATASSVQVRSPIHSRSVGQWQRYGEDGQHVDAALRKYGAILP